MRTIFGWAISGWYKPDPEHHGSQLTQVCHLASALSSHELLKSFSKTEEVFSPSQYFTPEDIDHFCSNHSHLSEGTYQVSMPRKPDHQPIWESLGHRQLGDSTPTNSPCDAEVLGRSSKTLWKSKSRWATLGHAEPMSPIDLIKPSCSIYYLPLHAILRRIALQPS